MELQQTLTNRRSIRKFKPQVIEDSLIEQLLEAARIAPSAKNIQPWKFFIAKGDIKNKIATMMKNYHKTNPNNTIGMYNTAIAIEQAPALILVFRDNPANTLERNDILSIGAAIENILLKATELNLGSLWICAMYNVREQIMKLINTELELYSAIAIGYSDEAPLPRPRKTLKELIIN